MNIHTVELKNQPGVLAHPCEMLGRSGVNIEVGTATAGDRVTVCLPRVTHPPPPPGTPDRSSEAAIGCTMANANVNVQLVPPVSLCQGEPYSLEASTRATKSAQHRPASSPPRACGL